MIGKVVSSAAVPVAAATAAVMPTVWHPLGYEVEAGPLCAGLIACFCVRFWANAKAAEHRWTVDVPVSVLTLLFTAAAIVDLKPSLVIAIILGTGFGALGAKLIGKAQDWIESWWPKPGGGAPNP